MLYVPFFAKVDVVDKRTMLVCLWDWILSFEKKRNGSAWDGKLPQEASCLLYQYALQTGISEETHVSTITTFLIYKIQQFSPRLVILFYLGPISPHPEI